MAILNSQYSFLAADFENPNLNKDKNKINKTTTNDFNEKKEIKSENNRKPSKKPTNIYLKSIPLFVYANAIPADIYSASLFLLIKNL